MAPTKRRSLFDALARTGVPVKAYTSVSKEPRCPSQQQPPSRRPSRMRTFVCSFVLFDLPEFSDNDVNRALKFTVARFNVMTPPSNDPQEGINIWLLLIGVCEFLCMSEAFRQQRNQLTYQDGDVQPIGLDDKQAIYLGMAAVLKAEFEDKAKSWKISRNLESAYGSLGSGYRSVSRFHHSS